MSQEYGGQSTGDRVRQGFGRLLEIYGNMGTLGKASVWILGTTVVLAIFGPEVAPFGPYEQHYDKRLLPPLSGPHILGTDAYGRDVFTRLLYGARISLIVAVGSISLAATAGVTLGSVAGWKGGSTDEVIMRITDIMFSFPSLILALALVAVLGPSTRNLIIVLGIVYTPQYARLIRSTVLSVKEEPYVDAAISTGLPDVKVLAKHIIPNAIAPVIVQGSFHMAWAMLKEAALSFLGLGVRPPTASWGIIIANGRTYMPGAWWLMTFPGLAIMIIVLAFNFIGDDLRDEFDPYEETEG